MSEWAEVARIVMRDGSPSDLVQFDIKRVFARALADLLFNTNISTRKEW